MPVAIHEKSLATRFRCILFESTGGFCGDVTNASDVISGRVAALLSSDCHIRAPRRVCLAEHCSGIGIATRRGVDSDLVAAIRRPPRLLPPKVRLSRKDRLSLSRSK